MKRIYIAGVLIALLSSCFEDKGNYDYEDIRQLDVRLSDTYYDVTFGDTLKVEATLGMDMAADSSRYTYTWYINKDTIPGADTRFLEWKAEEIVKDARLVLTVKDELTGITYHSFGATLQVVGIYENPYSWMVLSDKGGKSQLSYFSCLEFDDEKEEFVKTRFYEDVYTEVNGGELGAGPIALQEHYREGKDWNETVIGNVCVFQKSGAVDLNGESFEREIAMSEAFDGYPEGIVLYPGTFMDWVDILPDQDGRLYSRVKSVSTVFNSEYFLPTPLKCMGENDVLTDCQIAYGYYKSNRTGYNFVYDGGKKRMLFAANGGSDWYSEIAGAGKIEKLPAMGPNDIPAKVIPLDNMVGYELLDMIMYGYGYPDYGLFLCLKEETTGQIYVQFVKVTGSSAQPDIVEMKCYQVNGLPADPQFVTMPLDKPEYVFFGVGQDVYYYSINNPTQSVELYYHFNQPIGALNAETEHNIHMAVGLENGEFYLLNINGAKNIPMDERVVYQSDVKVGRIVDVHYKNMSHWNY